MKLSNKVPEEIKNFVLAIADAVSEAYTDFNAIELETERRGKKLDTSTYRLDLDDFMDSTFDSLVMDLNDMYGDDEDDLEESINDTNSIIAKLQNTPIGSPYEGNPTWIIFDKNKNFYHESKKKDRWCGWSTQSHVIDDSYTTTELINKFGTNFELYYNNEKTSLDELSSMNESLLTEKVWKKKMDADVVKRFRKAIDEDNYPVIQALLELIYRIIHQMYPDEFNEEDLQNKLDDIKLLPTDPDRSDDLIDDYDIGLDVDEYYAELYDYELEQLYNICDTLSIWLPLD